MDMEAKIGTVWGLNLFKIHEASGTDLLFHMPIQWVKIKISSKFEEPVVLRVIPSSIG